VSEMSVL